MNEEDSLETWLDWIARQHSSAIELGLERVQCVYQQLSRDALSYDQDCSDSAIVQQDFANKLATTIITVAGTNGKGSTICLLERLLSESGLKVGVYSSPHLIHFNERIRIDRQMVSDQQLCKAFHQVRSAQLQAATTRSAQNSLAPQQASASLSFFEFTTLAALSVFATATLDVLILEVGLGGRLDAVNLIDPDIAIITSIDFDHQQWLGDSLAQIASEKAGILRSGIRFVCGHSEVNEYLEQLAEERSCTSYVSGKDFIWQDDEKGYAALNLNGVSHYQFHRQQLHLPKNSIACALQAFHLVADEHALKFDKAWLRDVVHSTHLQGRFQVLENQYRQQLVLDVAHNPAAVSLLRQRIKERYPSWRVVCVFSALNDKPVTELVAIMDKLVDRWYLAPVQHPRSTDRQQLLSLVQQGLSGACQHKLSHHIDIISAYQQASRDVLLDQSEQAVLILGYGSFHVVAELLYNDAYLHLHKQ